MSNIKHKMNQTPRDKKGNQHGEWLYYYENGQLRYRYTYVHGVLHGFCEGYYDDSRLYHRGYYKMNRKFGYWYYSNSPKEYFLCLI